jgi:hypothetical protein
VIRIPLTELWRDDGFSTSQRQRSLTTEDVRQMLRSGPVQFVIADVGLAFSWIPESECFHFWKDEVNPHLATEARTHLDDYPGKYFYRASEWKARKSEAPIVVLEIYH